MRGYPEANADGTACLSLAALGHVVSFGGLGRDGELTAEVELRFPQLGSLSRWEEAPDPNGLIACVVGDECGSLRRGNSPELATCLLGCC